MEISFNSEKREEVLRERGLDLADASKLLSGLCFEMQDDRFDYGEDRWISVGMLNGEVVVCVWADWGNDHVRVITMWRAEPADRRRYYEYLASLL
jgi:hypothetical protein